jgi:hypothetical protein
MHPHAILKGAAAFRRSPPRICFSYAVAAGLRRTRLAAAKTPRVLTGILRRLQHWLMRSAPSRFVPGCTCPPVDRRLLQLLACDAELAARGTDPGNRRVIPLPDRLVDVMHHNEIIPAVHQAKFTRTYSPSPTSSKGSNTIFSDPALTAIGQTHSKSVAI